MNNTSKAKLTSAEIAALWTQYMNENCKYLYSQTYVGTYRGY